MHFSRGCVSFVEWNLKHIQQTKKNIQLLFFPVSSSTYGWICGGGIFLSSGCHFFSTLTANYGHFMHFNTAFNWLSSSIVSVGPRKSKFWTRHLRFSTWKPPVNRGHEFQTFYPFSPLLPFLFHASNPLKTFMKFYLASNYFLFPFIYCSIKW